MKPISDDLIYPPLYCEFQNSSNGILILDKVKTEKCEYFPECNNVIDRNTFFGIYIHTENHKETLKNAELYFRDIYDNQYVYDLIINGIEFSLGKLKKPKK